MSIPLKQGQNTAAFGKWLTDYFHNQPACKGFQVFYDHGDSHVNANVVATKAFFGQTVTNLNRFADVDVIVVAPDGNVRLLLEIEETDANPKKILGDVLAILMCNSFAVLLKGEQRYFGVTEETKLIVAGVVPVKGDRLKKIKMVILPRLRTFSGFSDAISPVNVNLVFSGSILGTITVLESMIVEALPTIGLPGATLKDTITSAE